MIESKNEASRNLEKALQALEQAKQRVANEKKKQNEKKRKAENHHKLHAQPVGFFWGNLAGDKGLPDMVGQHIVRAPYPSGGGNVLPFRQQKLGVGYPAVTRKAGDEPAVICLLRVGYIVDNVTDCLAFGAALADVQRHDACGCHDGILPS